MFKYIVMAFLLWLPFSSMAAPVPVNEAFKLELNVSENAQVVAHWTIAPNAYLYQSRLKFPEAISVQLPEGEKHQDADFGEQIIYKKALTVPFAFKEGNVKTVNVPIEIRYQGCSTEGFCYPPQTKQFVVQFENGRPISIDKPTVAAQSVTAQTAVSSVSAAPALPSFLNTNNTFLLFLGAFALGVVLCFTPCVLPMVPMLSTLIVGKKNLKTSKAFSLSIVYVVSMSCTYAIAGISAALLGQRIQTAFQSPWILATFASLFIILGLELAGYLHISMPSAIKSKAFDLQSKSQAGTFLGAIAMGILATLVASPCVSAPLMGVLGYITQTGDVLVGGLTLFAIGLGMGTPLVIAGTLGGKYLPKAGRWMQVINELFAILLFGFAIWIIERFAPAILIMPLWGVLCVYIAYKMGTFNLKLSGLLPRAGVVFIVAAGFIALSQTPLMSFNKVDVSSLLAFNTLTSLPALETALQEAKQKQQPTVVEFYADWCTSCKKMEKHTIHQAQVQAQLKNWHRVKANVTGNTQNEQDLLKQFNLIGPPSVLFFDKEGVEQPHLRLTGEVSPDQLIEHLKKLENI
jgi:thiol:disulfide interchange protein DsbD